MLFKEMKKSCQKGKNANLRLSKICLLCLTLAFLREWAVGSCSPWVRINFKSILSLFDKMSYLLSQQACFVVQPKELIAVHCICCLLLVPSKKQHAYINAADIERKNVACDGMQQQHVHISQSFHTLLVYHDFHSIVHTFINEFNEWIDVND